MGRILLLTCVGLATWAPDAEPDPEPGETFFKRGWDKTRDPESRRAISQTKNVLTIKLPAKDLDFDTPRGKTNAPRLLRDVKGDFTLVVRVKGDFHATEASTAPGNKAYTAAGIFLEADNKLGTRVRWLFGATREDGAPGNALLRHSVGYLRSSAGGIASWNDGHKSWPLKEGVKEAWLRLRRRGEMVPGEVSADGKTWKTIAPIGAGAMPATIKVGLIACSTSDKPLTVTFDQFSLTTP